MTAVPSEVASCETKAKHGTQNADAVSTQLCQTHTRAHNLCMYVCIRTVYATSLAAMAFSLDSCTLPNSEYWHLIAMVPDRFAEDPDGFTDHVERHDALLCTTNNTKHKHNQLYAVSKVLQVLLTWCARAKRNPYHWFLTFTIVPDTTRVMTPSLE